MRGILDDLGLGDPEAHHDHKTLKDFADGRLPDREDEAVIEHLMACSGSCLAFLDSLPDPHQRCCVLSRGITRQAEVTCSFATAFERQAPARPTG